MIPFWPTVVEAKLDRLIEPDMRPNQSDDALFLDLRLRLDNVKLKMMHPNTTKTKEIKLQKYHEVMRVGP